MENNLSFRSYFHYFLQRQCAWENNTSSSETLSIVNNTRTADFDCGLMITINPLLFTLEQRFFQVWVNVSVIG